MKNSDTPANPTPYQDMTNMTGELYCDNVGLTKREYFAGLAMQGFAANPQVIADSKMIALLSVKWADTLLAELEKGNE